MKISPLIYSFLILAGAYANGQTPSNLIIRDYGTIYDLDGVVKPKSDKPYKIVIDLKTKMDNPATVNPGLNNVARMLNLHAAGGIAPENLYVSVAIHGGATYSILDDAAYRQKYGITNPNTDLIRQLHKANVMLYVCSQSLIAREIRLESVNDKIKPALSMLTLITEKMDEGYSLLVFE